MKVLITGGGGQVATELIKLRPADIETVVLDRDELDIGDPSAIDRVLKDISADVLINAAAYTDVEQAESESQLAYRINGRGPGLLAEVARKRGWRMLHISTDFVFDGERTSPYAPDSPARPINVYGASKLDGERRVQDVLGNEAVIIRTAWMYAESGRNFVRTMLRLMRERSQIYVVSDQVGSPTWAGSLAEILWLAVRTPRFTGIHHWTDAGETSWCDFAVAISEEARHLGLLNREVEILPIATTEYPTSVRRPAYSVLDRSSTERELNLTAVHWRVKLRQMLLRLRDIPS